MQFEKLTKFRCTHLNWSFQKIIIIIEVMKNLRCFPKFPRINRMIKMITAMINITDIRKRGSLTALISVTQPIE